MDIYSPSPELTNTSSTIGTVKTHASRQPQQLDEMYALSIKQQTDAKRLYAADFIKNLETEVHGLRGIMQSCLEEEEDYENAISASADTRASLPRLIFSSAAGVSITSEPIYPSEEHQKSLLDSYFSNVHPVFRLLHKPTFEMHMMRSRGLLNEHGRYKFPSIEAITYAMYYVSVLSLSDDKCWTKFRQERGALLLRFQRSTELALTKADFINTVEIITLQALVLFMMALRADNKARSSWSLLGLAIQIAHSQRIHREEDDNAHKLTTYESEMRRRLWWYLVFLDVRSAEERGSDPMIPRDSYDTRMPCNADDVDFTFVSSHPAWTPAVAARLCSGDPTGQNHRSLLPLRNKIGITDMTFCLLYIEASAVLREVTFMPTVKDRVLTMAQKQRLVKECADKIQHTYLTGYDPTDQNVWLVCMFGRLLISKLWLALQYPLHNRGSDLGVLPQHIGLQNALSYLATIEMIENSNIASHILWFFQYHVPCHAIAVILAEVGRGARSPLADQAWAFVENNHGKWVKQIREIQDSTPWAPIETLWRKAQSVRDEQKLMMPSTRPRYMPHSNFGGSSSTMVPELLDLDLDGEPGAFRGYSEIQRPDIASELSHGFHGPDYGLLQPIDMPSSSMDLSVPGQQVNWTDWNQFVLDTYTSGGEPSDAMWGPLMQF
ncbi:hypothetical protein IFR05_002182 [Cadophora sp. M221]|nr:hypothetical protein IFR05_002182 [Cadophora sp. M221]